MWTLNRESEILTCSFLCLKSQSTIGTSPRLLELVIQTCQTYGSTFLSEFAIAIAIRSDINGHLGLKSTKWSLSLIRTYNPIFKTSIDR